MLASRGGAAILEDNQRIGRERYKSSTMISFLRNVCLWIRSSTLPCGKGMISCFCTISDFAGGHGLTDEQTKGLTAGVCWVTLLFLQVNPLLLCNLSCTLLTDRLNDWQTDWWANWQLTAGVGWVTLLLCGEGQTWEQARTVNGWQGSFRFQSRLHHDVQEVRVGISHRIKQGPRINTPLHTKNSSKMAESTIEQGW